MTNKLKKLLLIPSLLIAFSGAAAEQTGAQISISSDRQVGKLKDGVGIFEGNVEIVHGNRRITAERLEAHGGDTEGTVELIIATGKIMNMDNHVFSLGFSTILLFSYCKCKVVNFILNELIRSYKQ